MEELHGFDRNMPKISFVVLTYNSEAYIEALLNSLFKFHKEDIEKKTIEIVIVDNNSSDKTLLLVEKFNNIKIVENKKNLGFSKGINLGVSMSSSEFVIVLNPDTKFESGNILNVIKLFEKDKSIGVIGGKIVGRNGQKEKSAGRFLKTFQVFLMALGLDELFGLRSSPSKLKYVDFVSGGFMILRRKIFEDLDGFDENLFMYIEDMEFCFRARKEGYKVVFDPSISIYHESHGSASRGFAVINIYKGLYYFHKKHGNPASYFMVRLILKLKAFFLILIGKALNKRYFIDTYSSALKI